MVGADLHHRIRGEVDQFTGAHAGAGQHFHDQPVPRVAASAGDGHHLGGGLVVEEARQRFRSRRQVPVQDRVAGGCIGPVPFDDPLEEHPQGAQPLPMRARRGLPAADSRPGGQVDLEPFDVVAADVRDRDDVGGGDQPAGQDAQPVVGDSDTVRGEEGGRLGQVAAHRRRQLRRRRGDLGPLQLGVPRRPIVCNHAGVRGVHRAPSSCCAASMSATAVTSASMSAAARWY
jgi:hypothetical protein